jgi:PAS domain S-box-containing protein
MKKKILIVDDNSSNLYMLKSLLEEEDFEVSEAENGQVALDRAHADPPDMIVSDILMPVMDGYMFCRKCKSDEQLRQIPFVFYTATYTEPKDEKFALSLGADRFILKPQEPEALIKVLKEFFEEKYTVKRPLPRPLGEEMEFFRQYNEILFKKLEKKILDLEIANQELRILEERYRLSFDNATDVIYTIDTNLNVLSVSPSVERILGYKPENFIGRPVSDLAYILTPESFKQAIADISLILKGNKITATIYEFIAKDGTIKIGEISGSPIIRDGQIAGLISIARDITERKKVEKALEESEERYRELVRYAPAGIYEIDYETGMFTSLNDIICEYTGYTRDELLNRKFCSIFTEESQKLMSKRLEKLHAGEEIPETVEYCIRTKEGNKLWALVNARYTYEEGRLKGGAGVIYNITERKKAEDSLRDSEEFLYSIVENIPDMIFVKEAETLRFVRFNKAGEELLGQNRQDLLGKNDYDLFPANQADFFTEKDRETLKKKKLVDIPEEPIQTSHRGERLLHTKKIPIIERGGIAQYLLGISEDITEHKLIEVERKQSYERLRKSLGATIQAIAMVVEIRDPYTAGHQRRVADLARNIATEMRLSNDQIDGLHMTSLIHDIGKISVPTEILSMPRKLTEIEFSLIKIHPQSGYNILKDIDFPWPIARIVLEHHERMDGSGYPNGSTGNNLLVESKILATADVVESMASHRPYRPGLGINAALDEIAKNRGILYDPDVSDACLKLFKEKGYKLQD